MNPETDLLFPQDLLACPLCMGDIDSLCCQKCQTDFFGLGDIPCVFTTGIQQKYLWQHQMEMIAEQGLAALKRLDYVLQGYDLSSLTRERLELADKAMRDSYKMIIAQFSEVGITARRHVMYEHLTVDDPTEYYQHILRDWAWDNEPTRHHETHVNDANLNRILDIWENAKPEKMLILGAGAGRLSWDLHKHFSPQFTVASDINPFLLSCAHSLIKKQKSLSIPELATFPQIGFPLTKHWQIDPPEDNKNLRQSWFALGADVWNMPIKPESIDTVVTSWLLDVCGGDAKDLISVLGYLIQPGGCWINSGPLLYSSDISFDKKYSAEEILDFADKAGFDIEKQSVEEIAHMASPINARYHHEQVFSFCARKRREKKPLPKPAQSQDWLAPAWLIMHHEPVPQIEFTCELGHDFITQALNLVDGSRSIFEIAQILQPSLPEGVDAIEGLVAMFGQILEQMANKT